MEESQQNDPNTMTLKKDDPLKSISPQISVSEFSCHCCYDILVNPTTLNCGHSFCRHCLALWWASSKKTECPECREKWEGFPKVNILLRDAIEKLFPDAIRMRFEDIQQNNDIVQSLAAFQKYGNDQIPLAPNTGRVNQQRGGGFFSGHLPPGHLVHRDSGGPVRDSLQGPRVFKGHGKGDIGRLPHQKSLLP
uniref:Bifunctional apoptosis regulator n=1 Tax=Rousettus aegyptiacus TaxID=9407 RepID=A0A7J8EWT3_ROUAE|nr:bifunctional apoptosis regulator [Rousettus aegyptiacus]